MRKNAILLAFLFLFCQFAYGQIPQEISYQGVLTETDGSPVADGNYSMTFSLYDVATGGTALWQEAKIVVVEAGVFNVILGDVTPLTLPFNNGYWLGVQVGSDPEMNPRVKITASAYSLNAANAETVDGYEVNPSPTPKTILPLDDNGKIPAAALPALPTVGMDGVNESGSVDVTTDDFVEITSLTIDQSGTYDVTFNAVVVGEIDGGGDGSRYEFRINQGSVDGERVARSWWRPGDSDRRQAITIPLNGVDKNIEGPTTYYLVARKFDDAATDMLVFIYTLNAIWVTK